MVGEDLGRQGEELFARHPRISVGWQALQELYGLYLADDHTGALAALDRFCDLYATGQIPEFHDVVDTFLEELTEQPYGIDCGLVSVGVAARAVRVAT